MDPGPARPKGYAFGPFVMDVARRLLWRDGQLIALTPRAFDILLLVLQHSGEIVDKDHLLTAIWGETVVEEATVVRHVSTLRKALHLRPDEHDVLVTIPGRGYRFVADVVALGVIPPDLPTSLSRDPIAIDHEAHETDRAPIVAPPMAAPDRPQQPASLRWLTALSPAIAVLAIVLAVAGWALRWRSEPASGTRGLRQVTYDAGAPRDPSWSPDGQWLAFTSDRDGTPGVWLQRVDDPRPIRVSDPAIAASQPDWSPDGALLVFRSERDGGGLVVMAASGGPEQRVAGFGYHPRWSSDGTHILFLSTPLRSRSTPQLFVTDRGGAASRPILGDLVDTFTSFTAAWHPDGQRISIWGRHRGEGWTFVTAPIDGGPAVFSTMTSDVTKWLAGSETTLGRFAWSRAGQFLYFEGTSNRIRNLWRVPVEARSLAWIGVPERLTTTAAQNRDIAIASDGRRLVFVSRTEQTRVLSFPLDDDGSVASMEGEPVTAGDGDEPQATLPASGDRMVYQIVRGGYSELRAVTFADHRERLIASGTDQIQRAIWARDGERMAYWTRPGGLGAAGAGNARGADDRRADFVVLNAAGRPEAEYALTGEQGALVPFDWSSESRTILGSCGRPLSVCALDVAVPARAPVVVASDPKLNLYQAHFSPDARWIVFMAEQVRDSGTSRVYVVPESGGPWVPITDGQGFDDKPRWSTDGRTVYYVSNRGTLLNVWGRRFDPAAGQPIGDPFKVTTFTSVRRMISPETISRIEIGVAAHRLVLPVTETASQIWLMDNIER